MLRPARFRGSRHVSAGGLRFIPIREAPRLQRGASQLKVFLTRQLVDPVSENCEGMRGQPSTACCPNRDLFTSALVLEEPRVGLE